MIVPYMDSSISYQLFPALDTLVLRRSEENADFQVMGFPPDWVHSLKGQLSERWDPSQFLEQSCFLQYFLRRAKGFWEENQSGQLESGPWEEPTLKGETYDLEAMALAIGTNKVLVVRKLSPQIRSRLQEAREKSLQLQRQGILEERLRESEKARDDLLVILDQLQVGTFLTDTDGRVTFINQWGRRALGKTTQEIVGGQWDRVVPVSKDGLEALMSMVHQPSARRQRVPIQFSRQNGSRVFLEIDVQDDPRNSRQKIFFLYDVTGVQYLRRPLAEHL